jgi:hypothetical protein
MEEQCTASMAFDYLLHARKRASQSQAPFLIARIHLAFGLLDKKKDVRAHVANGNERTGCLAQ